MMAIAGNAGEGMLAAVGDTPLVELRRIVPESGARIFVKWEPANPTGSMKDRMAIEVIQSAAADGRLPPGETVVEYTAGTTGISLAFRLRGAGISVARSVLGCVQR
jgi:cysteine synthase A